MWHHSYSGEVFEYSLWHFILPDLKGGNKSNKFKEGRIKCKERIFDASMKRRKLSMFDRLCDWHGFDFEKFIMDLFNKMDSRREVKFASSNWKHTSSAWKWYYSFSREIFSFGNFFKSKHFSKIVALIVLEGWIRLEVDKCFFHFWFSF